MPSFNNNQTTLDLNGPILSFTTQPSTSSACTSGIATFVGIATATFPTQTPPNPAVATGYISYKWYWDGYGELVDGVVEGMTVVGSATTTLTLSNIPNAVDFNNSRFFLRADYIPSAYVVPGSDVTAGTARSTGNAINDPKDSDFATLTVYPNIVINSQPSPGISTVAPEFSSTFSIEATTTDPSQGEVSYQWQLNGVDLVDGNSITFSPLDVVFDISGAKTSTLKITPYAISQYTIRCKVTQLVSCNSPLYSNNSILNVVPPRPIIGIESYQDDLTVATLDDFNLQNGDYSITNSKFDSDTICLYAKERDIDVEVEMYGAKGTDLSVSQTKGGEGGYSKIRFTIKKNEEHILKGIKSKSSLFLYRKAQLISCVGGGGNAGSYGDGGRGGGVLISGETGKGRGGGLGGLSIQSGQMTGNGSFGSSSSTTSVYSEDTLSTGNNGGKTISCTKGVYWRQQGKTACEDLGVIKYRLSDGREVTNSALINRGFKSGYCINQTAGKESPQSNQIISGRGGNGATGGSGGTLGAGGGGGSGYTDTSIFVDDSTLGGWKSNDTKFVIRVATPLVITGSVSHSFNNSSDQTLSLVYSGAIENVSVESPGAPDFMISTNFDAKHYRLTLNANYSTIVVNPGDYTAGGGYDPGIYVARVLKEDLFTYRVWFNRSSGYNTYIGGFSITCVS